MGQYSYPSGRRSTAASAAAAWHTHPTCRLHSEDHTCPTAPGKQAASFVQTCLNLLEKKRKNISSPADHHTAWTSVVTQALPTTQSFPDIIPVWILTSNIDQEYFNTKKMEVCSPLAWQSTEMQCRSWLLLDTWLLCKVFVFMHLIQQINRTINLCAKLVPLGLVVSSGTQVQRGKSKDTQKCPALPWQSQG